VGIDVRVHGTADFRKVAARIRAEGGKDISREMATALRKATVPVQKAIREEYADLPSRGGYAATFSRSLKFKTSQRAGGNRAFYVLTTYADGAGQRRDIRRLEDGQLRHPIYGRSRRIKKGNRAGTAIRNPWAVTAVKGGFHRRGTARAMDSAEREMIGVLEDLASRLVE
jgi:hypothetical protein